MVIESRNDVMESRICRHCYLKAWLQFCGWGWADEIFLKYFFLKTFAKKKLK